MTAENQNFEVLEGDHNRIIFEVKNVDVGDVDKIFWYAGEIEKTLEDGSITIDEEKNEIILDLENEETHGRAGRIQHELKIVDIFGNISTLSQGKMIVKEPKRVIEA